MKAEVEPFVIPYLEDAAYVLAAFRMADETGQGLHWFALFLKTLQWHTESYREASDIAASLLEV